VKAAAGNLREVEILEATGDLPAERESEEARPGIARRVFDSDIA
jgi:hypothetical protein